MKKGLWIVITGLDGTGKTTLKNNLVGYFRSKNLKVKDWKFPYDKHLLDLLNNVIGGGRPWEDNYTDQLMFTFDNRVVGTVMVPEWRNSNDVLVSQRGYIDSFVHGRCRNFTYKQVDDLMRTSELARCDVMIHLNADPNVAFDRIKEDPDADKYEIPEYIKKQAIETALAYSELQAENPAFAAFRNIPNVFIDTTRMTTQETFERALQELKRLSLI
ncbi:MAG: hypothetical protein IKF38_00975 [Clostridia bacterium]|nr:hypothetical protein [Clostridia bacterium]